MRRKNKINPDDEICGDCGYRLGDHIAGKNEWPSTYCPRNEGGKNWKSHTGIFFEPTGKFKEEK